MSLVVTTNFVEELLALYDNVSFFNWKYIFICCILIMVPFPQIFPDPPHLSINKPYAFSFSLSLENRQSIMKTAFKNIKKHKKHRKKSKP